MINVISSKYPTLNQLFTIILTFLKITDAASKWDPEKE